jgi:hypothetical protein
VPDVVYKSLVSQIWDVFEGCREIVTTHILVCKLPEFIIYIRIQCGVVSGMECTTTISHEYIVTLIGQNEGNTFIFVINYECIRMIYKSMLKINYW